MSAAQGFEPGCVRRRYEDKASVLEQTLNERVLLAKQLEALVRTADRIAVGLAGVEPEEVPDAMPEE